MHWCVNGCYISAVHLAFPPLTNHNAPFCHQMVQASCHRLFYDTVVTFLVMDPSKSSQTFSRWTLFHQQFQRLSDSEQRIFNHPTGVQNPEKVVVSQVSLTLKGNWTYKRIMKKKKVFISLGFSDQVLQLKNYENYNIK